MKYNDNGEYKDIYIKTFDTLPVGAEVDYTGSVVPDGWTQVDSYSENEVDTGQTWIDGKEIYSKTFTYTNLSQITSGNFGTITTNILNANVVKIEAININSNLNLTRMLPYTDNTNLLRIITTTSNNKIVVRLYVNGSMFTQYDDAIVTLFYTKN